MDRYIPEELITKIRGSQDIVEVISRYLSLRQSGQNYVGLCPFHSEKTPSFVVSPSKQLYHCFGCGSGGNVITFLMKYENKSFPDAVKRLALDAGITVSDRFAKSETKERLLYEINKLASEYYCHILSSANEAEPARCYLAGRGLSVETIKSFNIGYAINSWNNVYDYLRRKGFAEDVLVKSGIVIPKSNGTGYYDRFRGRIMVPIYDLRKRVVGFGGRVLDDSTPKYLNSPETPIFRKGNLLYGLDLAEDSVRKSGSAIIVEGYMDVISAYQAGISNVVGTLGTALTSSHLRILSRFSKDIVLTFDSDNAGIRAALRTMDIVVDSNVKVRVVLLPAGEDPDSFIREKGRDAFIEQLQKAVNLIDFAIDRIIDDASGLQNGGSIDSRVRVVEECLAIVRKIPNRIERDYYLRKLSGRVGIEEGVLYAELHRSKMAKKNLPSIAKARDAVMNKPKAEEILLALIIRDKNLRRIARENLCAEDFIDPQYRELLSYVLSSERDAHNMINSEGCSPGIKDIMTRLVVTDMYFDSPEKTLSDCIKVLQRHRLDRELKSIEREIADAEFDGMFERVRNLLLTKQGVLQRKKLLYEGN